MRSRSPRGSAASTSTIRVENFGVAGAAAQISGERLFDLLTARLGVCGEQGRCADHHPRLAEAALQGPAQVERILDRMELSRLSQSLDRHELSSLAFDRQGDA